MVYNSTSTDALIPIDEDVSPGTAFGRGDVVVVDPEGVREGVRRTLAYILAGVLAGVIAVGALGWLVTGSDLREWAAFAGPVITLIATTFGFYFRKD